MRERLSPEELLAGELGMSVRTVLVPVPGPARPLAQGLGVVPGRMQLMRVETGHHSFALGLSSQAVNEHLVVSFHGVRADLEAGCSALRNLTWSGAIGSAVLALSDPLCESPWSGSTPRSSNYLLDLQGDADAEINALIDRVATELGVPPERVVLCGNSIGGASAMRIAAQRPVGRAIVSNTLTDLDGLRRYIDAWLRRIGCTWDQFDAWRRQSPWRFESVAAWQHGLAAGHDLRMVVFHAVDDPLTRRRQHPFLCAALGLDPQHGGLSADARTLLVLHDSDRHGLEPTQVMHQLAWEVFDTAPERVSERALPGLSQGRWVLEPALTEQLYVQRRDEVARAPTRRSEVPASHTAAPRPPLLPPVASGVLLLASSPAVALKSVARVLALLPDVRRLSDGPLTDVLRTGGRLDGSHLCDEDGPVAEGPGEWLLGVVRRLFQGSPDVLSTLPSARVLFLLQDPLEAIADRLQEAGSAEGDPEVLLAQAIDEWNRSTQAVLQACLSPDGGRIFLMAERALDEPAGWDALLAWLGRESTPSLQRRAQRVLQRESDAQGPRWPASLNARQRQRLLLGLDWAAYRQLLQPAG